MVIKTNQFMVYKAKVAVCSDIHTKHSMQREPCIIFECHTWWYGKKPLSFKKVNKHVTYKKRAQSKYTDSLFTLLVFSYFINLLFI